MDDLTMTKLCAEAMGYVVRDGLPYGAWMPKATVWANAEVYRPLHNDAQCFALVKAMKLDIHYDAKGWWARELIDDTSGKYRSTFSMELNRAICEAVAKLQQSKDKP